MEELFCLSSKLGYGGLGQKAGIVFYPTVRHESAGTQHIFEGCQYTIRLHLRAASVVCGDGWSYTRVYIV